MELTLNQGQREKKSGNKKVYRLNIVALPEIVAAAGAGRRQVATEHERKRDTIISMDFK